MYIVQADDVSPLRKRIHSNELIKLSLFVLLTIQRQLSDMSDFSITWGYTLITFIIK